MLRETRNYSGAGAESRPRERKRLQSKGTGHEAGDREHSLHTAHLGCEETHEQTRGRSCSLSIRALPAMGRSYKPEAKPCLGSSSGACVLDEPTVRLVSKGLSHPSFP